MLVVAVGLCFWQNDLLLAVANGPLPDGREPITFGVTEPFFTTVKLSLYAGILLALPVLLYQAYAYILPAFKPAERRVVLPLLMVVPALFIAGAVFAYFVVLPAALKFLLGFNADQFNIQIRGSEYYGFFVLTLISVGILFQIPVGTIAVTRLAIVTPEQLGVQPPLRGAGDRGPGDAAPRHRPGDDADLDGAAVRAVRDLPGPGAQIRPPTRQNRDMAGRLLGIALAACLALPAGAAASVLYVGDSLGVGTSPYLREQLDGTALSVDAEIGRPSGVGVDVLRSEIAPEHDAVIFDLGTNDDPANPDALAADLAAARDIAGDRCLVVATLNRPPLNGVPVDGLNRAVTSFASRAPNVALVDWHAAAADDPGMLIDGVHADADGYALRARLFARRARFLLERWRVRLGERGLLGADAIGLARARDRRPAPGGVRRPSAQRHRRCLAAPNAARAPRPRPRRGGRARRRHRVGVRLSAARPASSRRRCRPCPSRARSPSAPSARRSPRSSAARRP